MPTEPRNPASLCEEVSEDLARVLDGTAPTELYDHLADCDGCRDLRHDAERAASFVRASAADYRPPSDLAERALAAIDARPPTTERLTPPAAAAPTPGAPPEPRDPAEKAPTTERLTPPAGEAQGAPRDPVEEPSNTEPVEPQEREAATGSERGASAPTTQDPGLASAPAAKRGDTSQPRPLRLRRSTVIVGILAAAAAATFVMTRKHGSPDGGPVAVAAPWAGSVTSLARVAVGGGDGLVRCAPGGTSCAPLDARATVAKGSVLRTDHATRAELTLDDGTSLVLDRDTEIELDGAADRAAKLTRGALVLDVAHVDGTNARLAVPGGKLEVLGTKFAVYADRDGARVEVTRGVVQLSDAQGARDKVYAGEEGRLGGGRKLSVVPSTDLADTIAWSERSFRSPSKDGAEEPLRGLGELKARKPGTQDERDGAVRLAKHDVRVRISDGVARTEVEEIFENTTGEELEGIFRFPLPPDAQIERLALEVNGKLEEGAFVEKEKAQAIWRGVIQNAAPKAPKPVEEIIWVPGPWRDPALLEWKRGGRFELRIFPIPKRGSRRLVLAYTQGVPQVGGVRRYTYPLPYDAKGSTTIADFRFDAQVLGHDKVYGLRTRGYDVVAKESAVSLVKSGFTPTGDLTIEYALPDAGAEVTTYAYKQDGDDSAYALIQLRPKFPRVREDADRDHVIVLDTSRSMVGERLERARRVVSAMVREMDESDRVLVMACDSTCRTWGEGMARAGRRAADAATSFVDRERADGASDVAQMVGRAASEGRKASSRGRKTFVTYVGDGAASVGPTKPDHMTLEIRRQLGSDDVTVNAVAVGQDADAPLLSAVARGGGGVLVPYVPGEGATAVALSALSASYGVRIAQPELTLPAGLEAVSPSTLDSIRAGGETLVVARMTAREIDGEATLRGKLGKEHYERKLALKVVASTDAGNAFVPRQYAALRIADLERRGGEDTKKQIVDLSKRFSVASRYTSLLVLESEAMMNAFGLKRASASPAWTGEQAAVGTATEQAEAALMQDPIGDAEGEAAGGMARGSGADGSRMNAYGGGAPRAAAKSAGPRSLDGDGYAEPPPPPAPTRAAPAEIAEPKKMERDRRPPQPDVTPRSRPLVPMRRVWDRKATISQDPGAFQAKDVDRIARAEQKLADSPESRNVTKELFGLYAQGGRAERAAELAERWASKDAMDLEALAARADSAARAGDREAAVRILGGIVDMRSDDAAAQRRLARLYELLGDRDRACAHRVALAEQRADDLAAQAEAVTCARSTGRSELAERLLGDVASDKRRQVEALLAKPAPDPSVLAGDVRLEGTWSGGDVDLALVDKAGQRLSWTGGGKAPVTAAGVTSGTGESLAFAGLGQGNYAIEVTRAVPGTETIRGTLVVRAAGETRSIPFTLTGTRLDVGRVNIFYTSRLVPM